LVNTHIPKVYVLLHSNIQSTSQGVDVSVDQETQPQPIVIRTKRKIIRTSDTTL